MSRNVATFVIAVDGQITSDALLDDVVIVTHHMSVVASPVEFGIAIDQLGVSVLVSVDDGSDSGDLSNKVHGIFVEGLPVVFLRDLAFIVKVGELGVLLEVQKRHGEHGH